MSRNMFQFVGQALAAWLRAFANKIEPKATAETHAAAAPNTGDGPPAHWLERVRKDAPQLLHPTRPRSGQHGSQRGHSGSQQTTIAEPVRANPHPTVAEQGSPERKVRFPRPTPEPLLSWPSTGSKPAEGDESERAKTPNCSTPARLAEPSYPAQKEGPINTRVSSPFTRPISAMIARLKEGPKSEVIADNNVELPGAEQTGLRFPARVLRIERRIEVKLDTARALSKETRSISEAPRWPSQRSETSNYVEFPISARATPAPCATFPQFSKHPAPRTSFLTNGIVHEEIALASVAFPSQAQEDHWPTLPIEPDSASPAPAVAELEHLRRLDLEQKGKLWTG